jgi:hypothetical protein
MHLSPNIEPETFLPRLQQLLIRPHFLSSESGAVRQYEVAVQIIEIKRKKPMAQKENPKSLLRLGL